MIQIIRGIDAAAPGQLDRHILPPAPEVSCVFEFHHGLEGPERVEIPSRQGQRVLQGSGKLGALQQTNPFRACTIQNESERVHDGRMHLVGPPRGKSANWLPRTSRDVEFHPDRLAGNQAADPAKLVHHGRETLRQIGKVIRLASRERDG